MITKKELGFVSTWARKVPYPGVEYAEGAIEKLAEAFDCYNKYYNNKQYELVLSNGEQLPFEILSKNLCHLIGIEYKNLTSEYFDDYRRDILEIDEFGVKSYDLLKSIIDHAEAVLKYDYENSNRAINYYRVMVKCAIFEKLSDFSRFNFGVVNFDKDIYSDLNGQAMASNSDKFLYVQSNEPSAPYFMMGILQDSESYVEKYVAETLFAPVRVGEVFNNQEVVIPTQILITTEDKMEKVEATASEKIALLNQYKSIIREYNIPDKMNIRGDYESMLAAESNIKKRIK